MTKKVQTEPEFPPLPPLDSVLPEKDLIRCTCGSASFFDWGIILNHKHSEARSPRSKDLAIPRNVLVCIHCLRPVVDYAGDLYDASEYIDAQQIQRLIEWSQLRESALPTKAMDP